MKNAVQSHYLGLLSYADGLTHQATALKRLEANEMSAVVFGLEHEPVITLGVRGRSETDLVQSASDLIKIGFEIRQTERGGQATLHSPGQLVIYPCINLRAFGLGARTYVELVQSVTAGWMKSMGLPVEADSIEPGLFLEGQKIAAFGFKISRGMTSHGIAINVENDLNHFGLIRTCGVRGQKVTRLCDYGVKLGLEDLFSSWVGRFRDNLSVSGGPPDLTEARSVL